MNKVRYPKMLIVDNEETLCQMMHLILKDEECIIDCATSLKEGKEKWQRDLPPIVLLDNYLPDGRGIDLLENDITLLNNCKVIMITADDLPSTRKKAKALGVHYFIQKPFSLKLIKELMDQVIE
jgi:response regulator of citrate/malate metabolism